MVRHMNNMENIDKIRREAIIKIKEKIKKNPGNSGYLHPCNKERKEDMVMLGFSNGNEFYRWMQQVEIMKNPTDVEHKRKEKVFKDAGYKTYKEYKDRCAKNAGFKDHNERSNQWRHETGRRLSNDFNEDCSVHFGNFTENIMIQTFEDVIKMPPNNPGFDWICKTGEKIDNKGVCLTFGYPSWSFSIRCNKIADWFILSAWDNRDSLTPLHVWAFHKDNIVRGRKFCNFETFWILDTPQKLKELKNYEVTDRLDKLKELCNKKKRNITTTEKLTAV